MDQTPPMLSTGQINLMACKWILADAERRAAEAKPEPIPEELLAILLLLTGDDPDERP